MTKSWEYIKRGVNDENFLRIGAMESIWLEQRGFCADDWRGGLNLHSSSRRERQSVNGASMIGVPYTANYVARGAADRVNRCWGPWNESAEGSVGRERKRACDL